MDQNTNKEITERLDELERREEKIEAEEKEILAADQQILNELDTARKESAFGRTIYRFRFFISLLLTIGVALVWEAIGKFSETVPIISTSLGALLVGLVILWIIDRLTRTKQ